MTEKQTSNMSARAFLEQPQELQKKIFALETKVYEMRTLAEKCTTHLFPASGGAHDDRSLENLIVQIELLEAEKEAMEKRRQQAVNGVTSVLVRMPTPRYAVFLLEHYLDHYTLLRMAEEHGLTERHVRRLLRLAYAEYEELYNRRIREGMQ